MECQYRWQYSVRHKAADFSRGIALSWNRDPEEFTKNILALMTNVLTYLLRLLTGISLNFAVLTVCVCVCGCEEFL